MKKIYLLFIALILCIISCKNEIDEDNTSKNTTGEIIDVSENFSKDAFLIFYNDSKEEQNVKKSSLHVYTENFHSKSTDNFIYDDVIYSNNIELENDSRSIYSQKNWKIFSNIGSETSFYTQHSANEPIKQTATLKYIGNFSKIWYIPKQGISIPEEYFERISEYFDIIYRIETKLLTKKTFTHNYSNVITVNDSDRINILIYDIDNDYSEDQNSYVGGYFYSNDLYLNVESNQCEMFYLDSGQLLSQNKNETVINDFIISTLAHEFQHMLFFIHKNFNVNNKKIKSTETNWFTEMLSMLIEDLLNDTLEISESPAYRFDYYFTSGSNYGFIDPWINNFTDAKAFAYANTFAFGAYLVRNFGGVELLKELFLNEYIEEESVTAALKKLGYKEDFYSVVKKFPKVFLNFNDDENEISFNKFIEYKVYDYTLTFKNYDLRDFICFNDREYNTYKNMIYQDSSANKFILSKYYYGPLYLKSNTYCDSLGRYGFFIKHLGHINYYQVSTTNSKLKYYIDYK